MTISRKLAPYIIGGTNVALRRTDAAPTFVMLTDCSAVYYGQIRAMMGADTLVEMRWTEPNDHQPLDNPEQRADEWWARRRGVIEAIPAGDRVVYAGYNEIGSEWAHEFCRFELRRLQHLHGTGRSAAVGSWGVGHPDSPEYAIYAPLIAAMRSGDVLDFHEYASDYADIDNRWHVGRFTIPVHAANLGNGPIVVSEYGYDYTPDTGKGEPGWQLTVSSAGCLDMLRKGGAFYDTQPRVIGYAAYQIGSIDPKFQYFNMYGVWPSVVAEYAAAVVSPIPPADTTPEPSAPIVLQPPIREMDIVRVSQPYNAPTHRGIDYSCYKGTPIYAAVDGIAYRGWDDGGFGNYVRIEDGAGLYVYTAHLSAFAVASGSLVQAGDLIGYSGSTGNSTGPHLHFEVRRGSRDPGAAIDPTALIAWEVDEPAPEPTPELYLPENDPLTLAAATLAERTSKLVWWLEEEARKRDGGDAAYADAIHMSLIATAIRWRDAQ